MSICSHNRQGKSRDSSVGIGLGLRAERSEFNSQEGLENFLFATASRPVVRPTQPPILLVPGALSLGIKRLGREADHSSPSSAEVKNAWSYTSTHAIRFHGVVLSFTFTF
jgi:hypothetical protein